MFRPSGPDHVLVKTATIQGKPHRKRMWGLSQIKTNNMAEKVKVTALYIRKLQHCFLKGEPLRGMTVPLLLVLEPLLAEISPFLEQFCTSFSCHGRANTAQMGRLAAHLVFKLAIVALERGPSLLVTKTGLMTTSSSKLSM